jgi:hypothetical protein
LRPTFLAPSRADSRQFEAADIYLPLSQACGIVRAIRFLFLPNFIDLFTFFDNFDCFLPTID